MDYALPLPHPTGLAAAVMTPSLESVYREHFEFVHQKASRLAGPGIDPEDVVQEVFLVVARRLHTFDGTALMTTWLYGIILNIVRAMRRRAMFRRLFDGGEVQEDSALYTPLDSVEVAEARDIAYAILDKMSPKKREVFILAEMEELSCEEIGAIVGTKTETVWSRLHYAREEFERRLALRKKGRMP
jgi:RNA polymerase sigma-70 factor (ECF subfamily)